MKRAPGIGAPAPELAQLRGRQISAHEGTALAHRYRARADFLGYIARGLLSGSHRPFERSYLQALKGHHE